MSNDDLARFYVIRRCPECHGQVEQGTVIHFMDCPNTHRLFVADEVEVAWPAQADLDALKVEAEQHKINAWINDQECKRLEAENADLRGQGAVGLLASLIETEDGITCLTDAPGPTAARIYSYLHSLL